MKENRILSNVKWIALCKAAQSVLQLVIGMVSARYLGPENYGLIHYAASVTAFVIPVMQLGLNGTLVQELIGSPEKEGEILGTSLCMSLSSGVACVLVVGGFVSAANFGEPQTVAVCVLYSLSLLFQSMELLQYWFHSHLRSKYPAAAALCAYGAAAVYKIWLLVTGKSVCWFATVNSVEYAAAGFALFALYRRQGKEKLSVSLSAAKKLLAKSRYYIPASLMVTAFQNIDRIMLNMLSGDAETGFYSAAVTCTSVGQFLYMALIDSVRPVILRRKSGDGAAYEKSVSALYGVTVCVALIQGLAFAVFAGPLVRLLYGSAYAPAAPVLRILIWYVIFSVMGAVRDVWILAENKQHILWKINFAGVCANAALNALLVPAWGASGAALATVLTQCVTNLALGFWYKPLKDNNRLLLKGIRPGSLKTQISWIFGPNSEQKPTEFAK